MPGSSSFPEYADAGFYILGARSVMIMAPLPKGEMRIGIQFRRTNGSESVSRRNFDHMVAQRLSTLSVTHFMGLMGSLERPSLIRAGEILLRAGNRSRLFKKRFVQRIIDVG